MSLSVAPEKLLWCRVLHGWLMLCSGGQRWTLEGSVGLGRVE